MDAQRYDKQPKKTRNIPWIFKSRHRIDQLPQPRPRLLSIDLGVKLDLSEELQALRHKPMDAQRYVVSKGAADTSRSPPRNLPSCQPTTKPVASNRVIYTKGIRRDNADGRMPPTNYDTTMEARIRQEDYEFYILPLNPPPTPFFSDHQNDSDPSKLTSYDAITAEKAKINVGKSKPVYDPMGYIIETDDFERGGYTLTRTIIRPAGSSIRTPVLGIFPQLSLGCLNCCSHAGAFEEEVGMISAQRTREPRGEADIRVLVTEHRWSEAASRTLHQ